MPVQTVASTPVYPLCLGGNVFGWTADEAASHRILDAFVGAGGNLIDTADMYPAWVEGNVGGESESIIGAWLAARGRRDEVMIATKVAKLATHRGLAPANLRAAVEGSLTRLGIDCIDLYYAHQPDPSVPLVDTLAGFDQLVRDGKIRAYGLSNYDAVQLREACDVARANSLVAPAALQPRYNLVDRRSYESTLAEVVADEQMACFPFYGLAAGFLTGKYLPDAVPEGERTAAASHYFDPARFAVVDQARIIAADHGVEVATVALAWLIAQPTISAPIASVSRVEQLPALLAATTLQLSTDELARLDNASANLAPTEFD